jgi:hypothetical protein
MSRNRHFKQRQANRIDFMIMQENADREILRLRDQNERAMTILSQELNKLDDQTTNQKNEEVGA